MIGIRSIFKQTSQLSKTNNTLAVIPGLTFSMPANSVFFIRAFVTTVAAATPGQKTALAGMSTATAETVVRTMSAAAVVGNAVGQSRDGGANALTGTIEYFGIIRNTTAAAVTFSIQAAQSVTDVSAVTFDNGILEATQLQ